MKCSVVADTNIIVSVFISVKRKRKVEASIPLKVLSLLLDRKNKIIPIFNDDILDEYKETRGDRIDISFQMQYLFVIFAITNAPLAQLVEQWTVNPCVAGSSPAGGDKKSGTVRDGGSAFFVSSPDATRRGTNCYFWIVYDSG